MKQESVQFVRKCCLNSFHFFFYIKLLYNKLMWCIGVLEGEVIRLCWWPFSFLHMKFSLFLSFECSLYVFSDCPRRLQLHIASAEAKAQHARLPCSEQDQIKAFFSKTGRVLGSFFFLFAFFFSSSSFFFSSYTWCVAHLHPSHLLEHAFSGGLGENTPSSSGSRSNADETPDL